MNLKSIVETCKVRKYNNLDCKRCKYDGKTCTHAINILKVKRPSDYQELNKEEK